MTTRTITRSDVGVLHFNTLPSGRLCVTVQRGDSFLCAHADPTEVRAALDEAALAGSYTRTGESPDLMDGGVTSALVEKEAEGAPEVDYEAMWWKAEKRAEKAEENVRAREEMINRLAARAEKAEQERDDAQGDRNDALRREKAEQDRAVKAERDRDVLAERCRDFADSIRQEQKTNDRRRADLEKAEQERDEARNDLRRALIARDKAVAEQMKVSDERDWSQRMYRDLLRRSERADLDIEQPRALTAREHLDAAWEAATKPERRVIPAGTPMLVRMVSTGLIRMGEAGAKGAAVETWSGESKIWERRLLDTPEPARDPEAEKLDPTIDAAIRGHSDITSLAVVHAIADALAEEGVRAPGAES